MIKHKYKIDIILNKEEIAKDFLITCWSEEYTGKKRGAIKRAKELQKEWNAEMYNIIRVS